MEYFSLVICILCVTRSFSLKLPSTFRKCDWKHNDCLTESIENAIRQLDKPLKEYNVPNMAPLEIPSLAIAAGAGATAFSQLFKNLKVSGFTMIKCSKAEFDSAVKTLKLDCVIPEFQLDFDYEVKGRILVLPIFGSGPGRIILHGFHAIFDLKLDEYEKNGQKYFKVVEKHLQVAPEWITFKLDNLFDGDKMLGDNINKVMNDNWDAMYADVQPSYEEAFGNIFASIFSSLLAKVPVNELGMIA